MGLGRRRQDQAQGQQGQLSAACSFSHLVLLAHGVDTFLQRRGAGAGLQVPLQLLAHLFQGCVAPGLQLADPDIVQAVGGAYRAHPAAGLRIGRLQVADKLGAELAGELVGRLAGEAVARQERGAQFQGRRGIELFLADAGDRRLRLLLSRGIEVDVLDRIARWPAQLLPCGVSNSASRSASVGGCGG